MPRFTLRCCLVLTAFAPASSAQPQPIASPTPQATALPPVSPEALLELSRRGLDDELIAAATPLIAALPDDPLPRYLRGRASYEVGFWKQAESDLATLGDYAPQGRMRPASEYLARLRELKALCPPHAQDIRRDGDGKVLFRVYFGQDDEWTREIIRLLPDAYEANRKLVGVGLLETPVFLFDDHAQFARFYAIRNGGDVPGTWVSAAGSRGAFAFSRFNGAGKPMGKTGSDALRGLVAHEFNHCLVNRMLGRARLPIWLEEGIAEVAGAGMAPSLLAQQDARVRRIIRANGALSLSDISSQRTFFAQVDAMVARTSPGDPYAQSFYMARFFLSRLKPGEFRQFLFDLRDSRDFDGIFAAHAGAAPEAFYEAWREECRRLYGEMKG